MIYTREALHIDKKGTDQERAREIKFLRSSG
jgi:hypothetical protein